MFLLFGILRNCFAIGNYHFNLSIGEKTIKVKVVGNFSNSSNFSPICFGTNKCQTNCKEPINNMSDFWLYIIFSLNLLRNNRLWLKRKKKLFKWWYISWKAWIFSVFYEIRISREFYISFPLKYHCCHQDFRK